MPSVSLNAIAARLEPLLTPVAGLEACDEEALDALSCLRCAFCSPTGIPTARPTTTAIVKAAKARENQNGLEAQPHIIRGGLWFSLRSFSFKRRLGLPSKDDAGKGDESDVGIGEDCVG